MSIFRDMQSSRLVKFLLLHAVMSLVACAIAMSKIAHVHEPAFAPYFIAFVQTFLGSFAGALLSLIQLVIGSLRGFGGAGALVMFGHDVPLPVIAGVAALAAFVFAIWGTRIYNAKGMYFVFLLSSLLFLFCAYVYFVDMANTASAMHGHPALVQPER